MRQGIEWIKDHKKGMLLITAVMITLSIALVVIVGHYFPAKPAVMQISKKHSGFRWTKGDVENAEPITICIDGVSSEEELFQGTIVIYVDDKELYRYENCRAYRMINLIFICEGIHEEGWIDECHPVEEHYAVIAFSEDWESVMFTQVKAEPGPWDSEDEVYYVAPVKTQAEMIREVGQRAAYGTGYEGYQFD